MLCRILLAISLVYVSVGTTSAATNKVVCYWGTWSVYRWGIGKFDINSIDPTLCTHLIYGFVGLNPADSTVRIMDSYLDLDLGNFLKFNALRERNPNLKTLLAIGGWNEGSENYSKMAASPILRANLIASALGLLKTYGFDGFDLDWEYPAQRGGAAADVQNFVTLIKEFRAAFAPYGYLLTAAVAAAEGSVSQSYDVPAVSQYLDFINVMTYDLHGAWEEITGHNAPLYPSSTETDPDQRKLNVDACIRSWIAKGADPQKLVLGMGLYGRTFTLASSAVTALGAPIVGGGNQGKYTGESGFVGYHEVLELLSAGGWTVVWDDEQKVPHAIKGNQWIGYDNPQSISIKVEYAKSMNLGGVMVWSIDTDDHTGQSGTKNQLLTTINQVLWNGVVQPQPEPQPEPEQEPQPEPEPEPQPEPEPEGEDEVPAEEPAEVPTEAPTEAPAEAPAEEEEESGDPLCPAQGYYRDPNDCSAYYYCQAIAGGYKITNLKCSANLVYDPVARICNYRIAVAGC